MHIIRLASSLLASCLETLRKDQTRVSVDYSNQIRAFFKRAYLTRITRAYKSGLLFIFFLLSISINFYVGTKPH